MNTETVTISVKEYEYLKEAADKLERLEAYGVDNWGGYSDALCDSEGIFEEDEN